MSTTRTVRVKADKDEGDDWPGEKGFRREVDRSKGIEDFEDGERVPLPRYHGPENWEIPPRWAPDNEDDEDGEKR